MKSRNPIRIGVTEIEGMVEAFETGRITRRQLIGGLGVMVATMTGVRSQSAEGGSTFRSTGLNHIALRVTDVPRSRDFYIQHFGVKVLRDGQRSCFLGCGGNNFVALFRSSAPGLDHYCYTIEGYEPGQAVKILEGKDLDPERHGNRVYFDDPDGLTVQVTGEWDDYPGPRS